MVGWNKVTKPKNRGGLGLHAAKERNTILAANFARELRKRVMSFGLEC